MKIAVFYYSQTGQALQVAENLFKTKDDSGKKESVNLSLKFKRIIPLETYPFPWKRYEFFDSLPETILNLPPSGIHPIDLSDIEDADIIIIVGQSWFLSPSLPLQSFFADECIKQYLSGRRVVFVNACRNMWLMTSKWIKRYMKANNVELVGQIVLQDRNANLISSVTIVRWLLHGRKEGNTLFPDAGISDDDLKAVNKFGKIIIDSASCNRFTSLQAHLLEAGAIDYKPSILFIETIGHRIFKIWSRVIRKSGGFRDIRRKKKVDLFYYYLLFVLFIVSPFVQLFFYLTYPLHRVSLNKRIDCSI